MTWLEAALLGLLQGLTEFLPVSSSGHLVLGQYVLGVTPSAESDVTFEVFVHFGTVLSILTVYWQRVLTLVGSMVMTIRHPQALRHRYQSDENVRMGSLILVALLPTGIIYVLFDDTLEAAFQSPVLVCAMLLVTGVLLLLTRLRRDPQGMLSLLKALVIGLAQGMAMIPGISRSGATICAALYQNVSPGKAADFSFLLLLPVVLGATLIKGMNIPAEVHWDVLLVGTLVAYLSGIVAIRLVLNIIRRGHFHWFAWYCLAIGSIGLFFLVT